MTERHRFRLVHAEARRRACAAIQDAPDGYIVDVREPTRSLDQNAMLWPLLQCFADQLEWPINGRMTKLSPEDWKTILTAAFVRETQRVAPGLDGGMVLMGESTSKMGKRRFSEFLDFIQAAAVDRGVDLDRSAA